MAKKRYCLYLSRPLAHKLERIASQRHGSKSALLEEALRKSLEPEQVPGVEEGLLRRLNELHRALAAIARDQLVINETIALFVRYMLAVTPPLPDSDHEPARLTARKRIDVFLVEVGKRVAGNGVHTAEVLRAVPVDQPDLFATALGSGPLKGNLSPQPLRTNGQTHGGQPQGRALGTNARGQAAEPKEGGGHA
jgi:hypothetical protein